MTGFPATLGRIFGTTMATLYGTPPGTPLPGARQRPVRELYALLRAMYLTNGLYDATAQPLYDAGIWREALKPLRNPAFRTVEFYVARVWPGSLPGALPIETDNANLPEAVEQVWQWSNWGSQKQVFIRWAAIYGDVFVKVAQRADKSRVYFQLLDPHYVVDFDTDERGYLTYVRIDTPVSRRQGDRVVLMIQTEVWDKARGTRRVWEYEQKRGEPDRDTDRLGPPDEEQPLSAFGIDFVPIVHCMFRDIGEQRGMGAYTHAVDKITEADRSSTRLHQMLYRHNKNTWVLEGGTGSRTDGRNIPPPQIDGLAGTSSQDAGAISVGDESFYSIPAPWTLRSAVPQIDYAAALAILAAHGAELEQDLPELAYAQLRARGGDLSGRTVRLLLSDAIDRVLEVRGNCEDSLIRMQQMALTIGKNAGLFPALGGTFVDGDFDHAFEERDVLPADELEQATADKAAADAALVRLQLGWSKKKVQEELGLTLEEIEAMAADAEADAEDAADKLLTALDRGAMPPGANGAPVPPQPGQNGQAPAQVNGQFGRR